MDKTIKTKWVAALRSGHYTQGNGVLRQDNNFCCLGVLCDVVAPEKWIQFNSGAGYAHDTRMGSSQSVPTPEFCEKVELTKDKVSELWSMNDGVHLHKRKHSFLEIADYIEANL